MFHQRPTSGTDCKEFGGKLGQWVSEETTRSLLPTKLGLLLSLQATLTKPVHLCLGALAISNSR
eukprot:518101-Pelagomonas_calceolata.AAC.1